ncbi:hypothetical protein [Streptomyces acidiscabies]|uniref:Uncharacterized protein n=1 Tax=Streptomyces acidiscabies TaxID=42234 RepID=A0ABU4MEB7_9ACTN|nr:hypothetical protein [Streptomyces acidiscabies]MDX3026177.1 hypothetical protein [Streptomyces acidiscabies]
MNMELAVASAPVLLVGVLVLRRRKPPSKTMGLVREIRDLITLRMVLRDTKPHQRERLVEAHRKWRRG